MSATRVQVTLDDDLLAEAMARTGLKTKRAVVEEALRSLLRSHRYQGLLALEGKLHWDGDLNEMRRGRAFDDDR